MSTKAAPKRRNRAAERAADGPDSLARIVTLIPRCDIELFRSLAAEDRRSLSEWLRHRLEELAADLRPTSKKKGRK